MTYIFWHDEAAQSGPKAGCQIESGNGHMARFLSLGPATRATFLVRGFGLAS